MAGQEHFGIRLDTDKLQQDAEKAKKAFEDIGKEAEEQGKIIDKTFNSIAKTAALIGVGFSANQLVSKITQVRGEFQQLEVAFSTILRSEERANELMSQLVRTAAITPFNLTDISQGAKQLLAFGESAEKVNDDLIRLGNIAAGLSLPLGDLIYLYGTTMTQGRLYTQDFNQFTSRGIPMIKELAKEFGVAENEVKGLVEAGRVGFPEVQKVIQNLTNEGGMFFQLMEKQSKTITGQISNIEDSFDAMFNEIGQANEGIINDALSGVAYLVENYKTIGETLVEIAVAYGTYKAALVAVTAMQKVHSAVLAQSVVEQNLAAAAGITLSNAQAIAAARTKLLTISVRSLNAALISNPYTLVAAAVVSLGYGIYKLATYQTDYQKKLKDLQGSLSEYNANILEEQRNLQILKGKLEGAQKGTERYNEAKEAIIRNYSKYYAGLEDEIEKVGLTEQAYNKLTSAINKSFGARQYSKFIDEQQGILDEKVASNLSKIQEKMIDELGEEAGSRYFEKLRKAIIDGGLSAGKGLDIGGLDSELTGVLDKISGRGEKIIYRRSIENWIKQILTATKEFERLDELAKKRFGVDDGILPESTKTESEGKAIYKTLSEVRKSITETEKKISELRSKARQGLIGTGDVEQVISELDSLKKAYKAMTGVEYGKVKNDKTKTDTKQYLDELLQLAEDNEERKIEIEKQGAEKEKALIDLRYTRQIEAVKKLQEELTNAQGGTLTAEQQGIFDTAISGLGKQKINELKAIENEQLQAERKAMQDYLAEYGEYWEKRKAISEKYNDEIAKATTEGQKLSLQAEMTQALAKLDDEAQKKTSIIVQLFGDMSKKTVDKMRTIANEAEKLLAFIEGGEYQSGNSFGITEEQFKVLSQSPEKLESIKNEIATVRAEADKAEPIFDRIKDSLTDLFKNGGKEGNLNKNLQKLSNDVSAVMQSVGFLADSFGKLGDAFGGGIFSGIAEGLNMAMDTVNSAMQGAQAGSMFGPIGAAAGAAFGAVSSLVGAITQIHDKKKEKQIQRLQKQIDQLSKSYDDLGREVDKAYSKDASELIEQQNVALEQQKVLILKQIEAEKDKKDTDWGRIEKWEQQIEDINNTIEDNKEKAVDAIFGENVQSAIERFSSALTDAWANGTNAAQGTRDAVKQMMKQMVEESIKAAIQSSKSMEEIRQKLQEFYADEVLSGWEQDYIYNMADKLQEKINKQFGWAEDLFKDKGSTTTQTATAGGFEAMSQDSADELNGRFTALYESNLRIETQINVGNIELGNIRNIATEMRDIAQNCYFELIEIRENTGAIVKPIQQMQKDIAVVKQNTAKL